MTMNNDSGTPQPKIRTELFEAHLRKMRDRDAPPNRVVAVIAVHEALEAGIAVGRSSFPGAQFTPDHAIKLAEMIYAVERELSDDEAEEPEQVPSEPYPGDPGL